MKFCTTAAQNPTGGAVICLHVCSTLLCYSMWSFALYARKRNFHKEKAHEIGMCLHISKCTAFYWTLELPVIAAKPTDTSME